VEVGGEEVGGVEGPAGEAIPGLGRQDLGIDLALPEDRQRLPLGIVVEAGEADERGLPSVPTRVRQRGGDSLL
jgi:hypothetical protein